MRGSVGEQTDLVVLYKKGDKVVRWIAEDDVFQTLDIGMSDIKNFEKGMAEKIRDALDQKLIEINDDNKTTGK